MSGSVAGLNFVLALSTVLAQAVVVVLAVGLLFKKDFIRGVARYAVPGAFLVALGAVLSSLLYSEFAGFEPCTLCWYQRMLLFPQVILLGFALAKKSDVLETCLVLSGLGALIALYHYYGQMFDASALPCAAGEAVSGCAQRPFVEFGYITIPMMSLTTFALIAAFLLAWNRRAR